MSLDVSTSVAYSSAISQRRHSLCICPEHCPPRDISPSETFWTCPAFPDSAVNDNDLELTSTPPQSSSVYFYESESPSIATKALTTPIFKEFRGNELSPSPLTLNRSLRRESRVIVSTPSKSIATSEQMRQDQSHGTLSPSPSCERNGNRRHSEGGSQTCSKLFELELSPILEDAHWNDVYFGPVAPGREGSDDGTSSSTGGTSDSSLDHQSVQARATRPDTNSPEIGMTSNGEYCNEPPVPALTITSPTPETLQSVVFSDSSTSRAQDYDIRSRSPVPPAERSCSSGFLSAVRSSDEHRGRVEGRDFLTVPVKDDGRKRSSSNTEDQGRPEKEKTPRLWRAWKRLSRVFALPPKDSAKDTEKVTFGQDRQDSQRNGTRRSMSATHGATDHRDVIVARASSGTTADTEPKQRLSRIPALARRRMAKRHGNFKRYSVPF
ncbi:hypothetical protein Agabi119p4_1087 [Agaricus bisporus var. burnettii]|uniref:Uncharacterized protein n=1 Tax=Agaricus bisporus var. burnettii TaxID=192524 RepID=A0A8H7FBS5_AGABI|nr:hypothetical protein Agabi119p4_1087 [Agaricus bisporus var. burnettii]